MSDEKFSTRRRFFLGAGAVLAAPVAAAAGAAGVTAEHGALEARLAALEDERAIRELQQAYVRHVNAGTEPAAELFADPARASTDPVIRELAFDTTGDIEIAADRRRAVASCACVVSIDEPIAAPGCTLVDMARAQGEGVLRRTERRTLTQTFVRRGGIWKIEGAALRDAIEPA